MPPFKRVLVTGGAGYIGSMLVPKLLSSGHEVNVLDPLIYGNGLRHIQSNHPTGPYRLYKSDTRDREMVRRAMLGCEVVIHLASISNDPCFDLDAKWCRAMDVDTFYPLIEEAKRARVKRFIYASSSSVYGSKADADVTEDAALEPISTYSESKVECERILTKERCPGFTTTILRPATVCGYSERLRLDVVVNLLTSHGLAKGCITVKGGEQTRGNLHIRDMVALYDRLVGEPDEKVDGKIWNVGAINLTVRKIAEMAQSRILSRAGLRAEIVTEPVVDRRSYRVSSERIERDLGFVPQWTVEQAISELCEKFKAGLIPGDVEAAPYVNAECLKKHIAEQKGFDKSSAA